MPQVPSAGTVPRYVGFLWRSEDGLDRAMRDKTGKTTPLLFSQRVEAQLSGTEKREQEGGLAISYAGEIRKRRLCNTVCNTF